MNESNIEGKRSFLKARDPSIDRRFRPRPERQVRLFDEINEEDSSGSDESYLADDDRTSIKSFASVTSVNGSNKDKANVFLRMRPVDNFSSAYTVLENVLITGPSTESSSSSNNKNMMEKHYSFSAIYTSDVSQLEVYEKCIGGKILSEDNFTILTYGTSGSGKTFTLLGDNVNPGIIPRTLENIFTIYKSNIYAYPAIKMIGGNVRILDDDLRARDTHLRTILLRACSEIPTEDEELQRTIEAEHSFESKNINDLAVLIWVSFVEIYNEMVYDLLIPPEQMRTVTNMQQPQRKNLKIVQNNGKVFVKGLTTVYVKTSLEAMKLLRYGLKRVTYASTLINENSSRSHCIFFVDIIKYTGDGVISEKCYKFCDLAGSERLNKTGNVGSRLKEAQRINTSLLVLGRCLDAVNNAHKKRNEVIPVRESKLTMLLQGALLGNEKLTMIVNVTPNDTYYEENVNVLGFASIAQNIVYKKPVVKCTRTRYSLLMDLKKSSDIQSREQDVYIEKLLEEHSALQLLLEEMEITHNADLFRMEEMEMIHNANMLQQEQRLREELVESFKTTLLEKKEEAEKTLKRELDAQKRRFEAKIAVLMRNHQEEIEDLREEFEQEKENIIIADKEEEKRGTDAIITTTISNTLQKSPLKKRRTIE